MVETVKLSNGIEMPLLGLGVFKIQEGDEVERAVRVSLDANYRHIDTAALYGNEAGVGKAVRQSHIPREEIFITTKVWNGDQGYDTTLQAFEKSMELLQLEYLDLYLVHWPVTGKYKDTWRALEHLYQQGKVKAIGVSNFSAHHVEDLMTDAQILPMVNQVEMHPRLQQPELVAFSNSNNIRLTAWRPIMKGAVNDIQELKTIGEKHSKSPVQVTLPMAHSKRSDRHS